MSSVRRILLVEDSDDDVELITEAIEKFIANQIDLVRDGAEALDYLHRRGRYQGRVDENPSVIILDLKLPKVGGLEVLEAIRAEPSLRRIPVVVLTSSSEEVDLLRSYELGSNAFVRKPVQFPEFAQAVGSIGLFWGILNETPTGSTP